MNFAIPETQVKFFCRAKYYRTAAGQMKLAQVQQMSIPAFRVPGFEEIKQEKISAMFEDMEERAGETEDEKAEPEDIRYRYRSLRRAKITAFDKILCNPDLDTFATFTLSPEAVGDRASWDDCYHCLKVWLSNRVSRNGLKYVVCPERHIKGGIHFHGIMNSEALHLIPATNAHTGEPLTHNGETLYNVLDWQYGFSSAALVRTAVLDREKVAKYIFKYMGKQGIDGMIGGRYVLSGGKLHSPFYLYGETPGEFMNGEKETGSHESEHEGIRYREWNYI